MPNAKKIREELVIRDGEDCWLCGQRLDFDAEPNSNYYPSIDHVVCRARGGTHDMDNLRLAHRICNSRKDSNVPFEENVRLQAEISGEIRRQRRGKRTRTGVKKKSSFAGAEVTWK